MVFHAGLEYPKARMRFLFLLLLLVLASCAPRVSRVTSSSNNETAPVVAPRPVPPAFANMVVLVNKVRAAGYDCGAGGRLGAAPPVAWNPKLAEAAADHNRDMLANNFFSHADAKGRTAGFRVERRNYDWRVVGENLAYATPGRFTDTSVVEAWLDSPGHCAVLMNGEFREMGAATLSGDFEFWTQVFATHW